MSSNSSEGYVYDAVMVPNEESEATLPKLSIKCPSNPIKIIEPSPPKPITSMFLFYNCKKLNQGFELSLKGEQVFKKTGKRIDDQDLPTICAHLEGDGDIISLDLSNNLITDSGFYILCAFLLHSNLINLNLRNNEIKNPSEKCFEMLGNTCLKRLTLSGNELSPHIAYDLELMLKGKALEVLELAGVGFYVYGIHKIVDALVENDALKVLNISRVLGIPKYRLRSYYLTDIIYTLLVRSNSLVELHLEKTGITDHDVEKIVKAFKFNRTLLVLNLSANYISNIGLERIATILPDSNLRVLLLRSNTIGNHGAIALSKAMPLSRILHLDIAFNRIDDTGLANILWTIKKPTPLYTFYIFGNHFTKETLERIHVQMLRGKIIADSLDIILYWDEDGLIRCAYNPDADEYRNQMAGMYDGTHVASKPNILSYPIIDVLNRYLSLERAVHYPEASNSKILSHYRDHIIVK